MDIIQVVAYFFEILGFGLALLEIRFPALAMNIENKIHCFHLGKVGRKKLLAIVAWIFGLLILVVFDFLGGFSVDGALYAFIQDDSVIIKWVKLVTVLLLWTALFMLILVVLFLPSNIVYKNADLFLKGAVELIIELLSRALKKLGSVGKGRALGGLGLMIAGIGLTLDSIQTFDVVLGWISA